MSNNGTAPAGGAGGKPTLDQIIFMGLSSNPAKITSWSMLGTALTGLAVGKVLLDTGRYFDFFHHKDAKWIQVGVVAGTLAVCAHWSITITQSWKLAQHAFTDFASINRFDSVANYCSDLIGVFTNLAASSYFSWRVYKMSGRKIYIIAVMMLLVTTTFVMGAYVSIRGMTAPDVNFETANQAREFSKMMRPIRKAWGGVSMASDGLVVLAMLFYLSRTKNSIFHREKRIYHKLNVLILETMLPPATCVLILDITAKGSPTGDFRRVVRMLLPVLFFLSLLHSLVARATIREMLGGSLASTNMVNREDTTTNAGESMFVATYHADDEKLGDTKERDLESGSPQVAPFDGYRRAASPGSDLSKLKSQGGN